MASSIHAACSRACICVLLLFLPCPGDSEHVAVTNAWEPAVLCIIIIHGLLGCILVKAKPQVLVAWRAGGCGDTPHATQMC